LDAEIAAYFAGVIELAQAVFDDVEHTIDSTPQRSILRLRAIYGTFRIVVTELYSDGARKYRYYLLDGTSVAAGFDNSSDPRALRLRYGTIHRDHVNELIPHLHLADKTELVLTDEMRFGDLIQWLDEMSGGNGTIANRNA